MTGNKVLYLIRTLIVLKVLQRFSGSGSFRFGSDS